MGLFPCTWNLPVRFTQTLDKKNKVVKYARGRLVGWELQDVDTERVAGSTDAELVLTRMPRKLFVRLTTTSIAKSDKQDAAYVCAVVPKKVVWYRDAACNAPVVRLGFPVVPDFAGTIHSYTGENLPTGIVDCLSVEDTPRPEDQWKAYIGLSRLTSADGLLLAQPFAPYALPPGSLAGPDAPTVVPTRRAQRRPAREGIGESNIEKEAQHGFQGRALAMWSLWERAAGDGVRVKHASSQATHT